MYAIMMMNHIKTISQAIFLRSEPYLSKRAIW